MIKTIVDCDPGHDDAVALAVAAVRSELLGVTTVAGNVGLHHTTTNALTVMQLLGHAAPVHAGATGPLHNPNFEHASHVHGQNGLAGATMPALTREVDSNDAIEYLIATTAATEGIWIVAVGPLTNLALALQREPRFADRIAGISIMGGGTFGNVTAAAEFNIHFDPEAADAVLRCGAPIVMCGLDLTHQLLVDDAMVADLSQPGPSQSGSGFAVFAGSFLDGYLTNVRTLAGSDAEAALHDPCAVLAISDPELFAMRQCRVRVELDGKLTRGMTVVDRRSWVRGPVDWAETLDAARARAMIMDAMLAAP